MVFRLAAIGLPITYKEFGRLKLLGRALGSSHLLMSSLSFMGWGPIPLNSPTAKLSRLGLPLLQIHHDAALRIKRHCFSSLAKFVVAVFAIPFTLGPVLLSARLNLLFRQMQ